jgi:Zn-dependent protease
VPLVILLVSGGKLLFGWAKPVPVNYSALRKPRRHMALVAAAGPGANLAMALAWALVLKISLALSGSDFFDAMSRAGIIVNLVFMFLNLLPILPLDGGRIVASLLPSRAAWRYAKLEPWGIPLLLVLLVIPNGLSFLLRPIIDASDALIRAMMF